MGRNRHYRRKHYSRRHYKKIRSNAVWNIIKGILSSTFVQIALKLIALGGIFYFVFASVFGGAIFLIGAVVCLIFLLIPIKGLRTFWIKKG